MEFLKTIILVASGTLLPVLSNWLTHRFSTKSEEKKAQKNRLRELYQSTVQPCSQLLDAATISHACLTEEQLAESRRLENLHQETEARLMLEADIPVLMAYRAFAIGALNKITLDQPTPDSAELRSLYVEIFATMSENLSGTTLPLSPAMELRAQRVAA